MTARDPRTHPAAGDELRKLGITRKVDCVLQHPSGTITGVNYNDTHGCTIESWLRWTANDCAVIKTAETPQEEPVSTPHY